MNDIDYRKSFVVKYFDIADGQLENADVDFWEIEGLPIVHIFDGKTGAVALSDVIYKFPRELLCSYNGRKLSKEEFFRLFPETLRYFQTPTK